MAYTDNYERDAYGIIAFWVRNDYDHGRFFDREISHHELELARANQHMIQRLGDVWQKAESKQGDIGSLIKKPNRLHGNFTVYSLIQWINLYTVRSLFQRQHHFLTIWYGKRKSLCQSLS